ncbi:MAG TPA: hypothetical protein VJJ21_05360 [Candidatus Nanoarchaeia archaeon]|nr:hypothetical protein [Candidatus Nanoarchaeia archaeon]
MLAGRFIGKFEVTNHGNDIRRGFSGSISPFQIREDEACKELADRVFPKNIRKKRNNDMGLLVDGPESDILSKMVFRALSPYLKE